VRRSKAQTYYWTVGIVVAGVCALMASACSSASTTSAATTSSWTPTVTHEKILLLPPEYAGVAGWCMKTGSVLISGCGAYAESRPPIVAETWSGEGDDIRGFALTTSSVTSVAVKDGAAVPTEADPALPAGLRSVIVELRGKGPANGEPFPRFTPLNSKGERIRAVLVRRPLTMSTTPTSLPDPAHPSLGACRIEARHLSGLTARTGSVTTRVGTYSSFPGRAFQACASTAYGAHNVSLLATVLLSAATPRATPASLPAALPLPGHPGVVYEPDVTGGETVARRDGGAWLVVSKGESRQQRLTLLKHVRVTLDL
jgi:hypothetical protein